MKTKKIVILGATGGCVDILDLINSINAQEQEPLFESVGFLDDKEDLWGRKILGVEVLGPFSKVKEYQDVCLFITGIGSPYNFFKRADILTALEIPQEKWVTIVHPSAYVSPSAKIGNGTVIFQNAVVTTNVTIGSNVLILPNTVINHDSVIGNYTIITSSVSISGNVCIGCLCYIGAGTSIRQNVTIAPKSMIGMGSVVIQNVEEGSIVVGNPARVIRRIVL